MSFPPHAAAVHAIQRSRALLEESRQRSIPSSVQGDMRRLSTVMAVAALDTYLHRLILEQCYLHKELPRGLASLSIPFGVLLAQADETAIAARKRPHDSRPRVGVKRQLRDRLLRETYQRFDDVADALAMAGRSRKWDEIASAMKPPMTRATLKERLDAIVDRRNQIVHEGDYLRMERPRDSKRNGMTHPQALAAIDFIAMLIEAIFQIS